MGEDITGIKRVRRTGPSWRSLSRKLPERKGIGIDCGQGKPRGV